MKLVGKEQMQYQSCLPCSGILGKGDGRMGKKWAQLLAGLLEEGEESARTGRACLTGSVRLSLGCLGVNLLKKESSLVITGLSRSLKQLE